MFRMLEVIAFSKLLSSLINAMATTENENRGLKCVLMFHMVNHFGAHCAQFNLANNATRMKKSRLDVFGQQGVRTL